MARITPLGWTILILLLAAWLYGAWQTRDVDSDTGTPTSAPLVWEDGGAGQTWGGAEGPAPVAAGGVTSSASPAASPTRASRSRTSPRATGTARLHHLNWAALRQCESGNNYKANTGNGYYGAYQFELRTWRGLGYPGYPHTAAPDTQDAAARDLYADRGRQPWPYCGRFL